MQLGCLGSAVSSSGGVWGEALADKRFDAYLSQKSSSSCDVWILLRKNVTVCTQRARSIIKLVKLTGSGSGSSGTGADPEGTAGHARVGVEGFEAPSLRGRRC